jgi:hypothetical protein
VVGSECRCSEDEIDDEDSSSQDRVVVLMGRSGACYRTMRHAFGARFHEKHRGKAAGCYGWTGREKGIQTREGSGKGRGSNEE